MITVRVPEESIRANELFVAHSDISLDRGFEPGERVVVKDARTGGAYAATVADAEYLLEDTVYRLVLRGRLPHGVAAQVPVTQAGRRVDVADVLGMLAELKSEAKVPAGIV
jgi:hypothetical protein